MIAMVPKFHLNKYTSRSSNIYKKSIIIHTRTTRLYIIIPLHNPDL